MIDHCSACLSFGMAVAYLVIVDGYSWVRRAT
jgi:hypothetical protein